MAQAATGAPDREVVRSGEDVKGTCGERFSLGEQQGTRRRGEIRKIHLKRVLITSAGSSALPASQVVGRFISSVARPAARPFAKVGHGNPAPRGGWRHARLRRRRRHGPLVGRSSRQAATSGAGAWMTGSVSYHDAHYAECLSARAVHRPSRPSPPY